MALRTPPLSTATSPEPYWLGRASDEQQRLLKQHKTWTEYPLPLPSPPHPLTPHRTIGYLIPPFISSSLPPNARIADIGTGTGIWPIEASLASPSTHTFIGFDISSEQFLPPSSIPPNVTLSIADFKQPIPEDLKGTFDLVNIRLIIVALGPEDAWKKVLANVLTLLKPGGAICWTEGNFLVARGFRGADAKSSPGHYLTAGYAHWNATLKRRFGFSFPSLTKLFTEAGLLGVKEDVLSTDRLPEWRGEITDLAIGAMVAGLRNMARVDEEGWDEGEVERWREKAVGDRESGAYLRWDIHVAVGFRPV